MNFTREPIIETIISPRDGCKLIVRNSNGGSREEYTVDAVEVVSFGHSFFYRSLERPRSFLLPVSDYEVLETKETRVVLKNTPTDKSIKIGGGKDASHRMPVKENSVEIEKEITLPSNSVSSAEGEITEPKPESRYDKKRDRRRGNRKRRSGDDYGDASKVGTAPKPEGDNLPVDKMQGENDSSLDLKGGENPDEAQVSSPIFRGLFPPPKNLISETIQRQKSLESAERVILSEPIVELQHPHPVLEPVSEHKEEHHHAKEMSNYAEEAMTVHHSHHVDTEDTPSEE